MTSKFREPMIIKDFNRNFYSVNANDLIYDLSNKRNVIFSQSSVT